MTREKLHDEMLADFENRFPGATDPRFKMFVRNWADKKLALEIDTHTAQALKEIITLLKTPK